MAEDSCLVRRDAVLLGEWFSTFPMIVDPEDNETSVPTHPLAERYVPEDLILRFSMAETSQLRLFRETIAHYSESGMKRNITLSEQNKLSFNVRGRRWLPLGFKIEF